MTLLTPPPAGQIDLSYAPDLRAGVVVHRGVRAYFESAILYAARQPRHAHKRIRQAEALFLYSGSVPRSKT